ncbi:UDP-3-O-[3-hydroxymyristoyl] glucosamine N-acyltransferase [Chitinispirillum alkaliphilum]|nr:UDP-3-O-[3-hydroxymyristoyl] glucosamine N-acyltransferase [Chitinispirillum alkaliphilum]
MKLSIIADAIGAVVEDGDSELDIQDISSPEQAGPNSITFLSNSSFRDKVEKCSAAAVIISQKEPAVDGKINLKVSDAYAGYAKTAQLFEDRSPLFCEGISEHAFIDSTAVIDSSSSVGPGTVIGSDVVIGAGCRIGANCVIERGAVIGAEVRIDSGVVIKWGCRIGSHVTIQSGAVIGSDGFGNARENGEFIRIPCFGVVIIEDGADIGAGTVIDRGNFEPTVIHKGVKLDNLIHVAHNVVIGENSAIAAQTGISGSTCIGKRVIVGGQAGFVGHIEVGDDTFIGAKAGVSKGTEPGSAITGYPARDLMTMRRVEAAQAKLPSLIKDFRRLQKEIEEIKEKISPESA